MEKTYMLGSSYTIDESESRLNLCWRKNTQMCLGTKIRLYSDFNFGMLGESTDQGRPGDGKLYIFLLSSRNLV